MTTESIDEEDFFNKYLNNKVVQQRTELKNKSFFLFFKR